MESSAGRQQFHLSQALLGWMFRHKRSLLVTAPASAPELKGLPCEGGVRSLLCVPLMVKSKLIGVLVACHNKQGAFHEDDQRLLSLIASYPAQEIGGGDYDFIPLAAER